MFPFEAFCITSVTIYVDLYLSLAMIHDDNA